MAGVRVSTLTKAYGPLTVLTDISIEVAEGEFTVLLGPSGCGKSTLLNAIAGLDEVDGGTIEIAGQDAQVARDTLARQRPRHAPGRAAAATEQAARARTGLTVEARGVVRIDGKA